MATTRGRGGGGIAGISTGGIIVIVGVVLMLILESIWIGLIVTLVGLLAFGGFVKGRWY